MMYAREEFSFLKKTARQSKKIDNNVYQLICDVDTTMSYGINYSNLTKSYLLELERYKNYPQLLDIDEFSMNYSFGYHSSNNIDSMQSKEAMFLEVKNYLADLKFSA